MARIDAAGGATDSHALPSVMGVVAGSCESLPSHEMLNTAIAPNGLKEHRRRGHVTLQGLA